jgi:hypothetical protein
MTECRVTVRLPESGALLGALGLAPGGRVQQAVDYQVASRLEPYMPKQSGAMIGGMFSATVYGSGQVRIPAPYAALRSKVARRSGLRGPRYIERMKADQMEGIVKAAKEAVRG